MILRSLALQKVGDFCVVWCLWLCDMVVCLVGGCRDATNVGAFVVSWQVLLRFVRFRAATQ